MTDKTKSAAILSIATLVGFLPQAILGPFIGVLIDRYDRSGIMIFADLSIACVTFLIAQIPKTPHNDYEMVPNLLREAKEGLTVLRQEKGMMSLMIISSLYAMIYFPIGTLYPLICMSYFGGTFKDSSLVEIVFSAGTLLGAVILGKWGNKINKITAIILSIAVMGVGLILTGILHPNQFKIFIILAGIMGITIPFYYGVLTAIYQIKIQEEFLGRVLSLSTSLGMIAMPIGLILSGSFADIIGVEKWFFLSGLLTVGIAIIGYILPSLRHCCNSKDM